tara:strand:+ start:1592 stop:1759 length:168 start_codon:yes stop_codon:yes gene_type:complete
LKDFRKMMKRSKTIVEISNLYFQENNLDEIKILLNYCIVVLKLKLMPLCLKKKNQ